MAAQITRRRFLELSAGASASLLLASCAATRPARTRAPGEKLNVAVVGCGGRGYDHVQSLKGESILALCDVDARSAKKAFDELPDVRRFQDYRTMLAELGDSLDAVIVATPDHMHASIAAAAMRRGINVYVEKPLTWSIGEARMLRELARTTGVVTQMGNQGSSHDGFRRGVELLRSGALGDVDQILAWTDRPIWPQGVPTPTAEDPVPPELAWDLWLGVAPARAYNEAYLPFRWRGWVDYGTGALGDMACHVLNLPWRGLDLGVPRWACAESTPFIGDSYPAGSRVTLRFAERDGKPPVTLIWFDGTMKPPRDQVPVSLVPEIPSNGVLVRGTKGYMFSTDAYGAEQSWEPEEIGRSAVPQVLRRAGGKHMDEFLDACRGGPAPYSSFDVAGPFTEAVLLGVLALRAGVPVIWDAERAKARGIEGGLEHLVHRDPRPGFRTDA